MPFPTDEQFEQLLNNGANRDQDHAPVIKIEMSKADFKATYLLSEIYPADPTIAFGLCDLHMGFPELGDVDLMELAEAASKYRLSVTVSPIERQYPMSVYARAARLEGEITTDEADLSQAAYDMKLNTISITSQPHKLNSQDRPPGLAI